MYNIWNNLLQEKKIFPCLFREPLRQTASIKVTGDNKVTFAPSTNIHQSKLGGRDWTEKKWLASSDNNTESV